MQDIIKLYLTMYKFTLPAAPSFVAAIFSLIMSILVVIKHRRTHVSNTFAFVEFTTFLWQIGIFFLLISRVESTAGWWYSLAHIGFVLLPAAMYHFIVSYFNFSRQKVFVYISYMTGIVMYTFLVNSGSFVAGMYRYPWGMWGRATEFHPYLMVYFVLLFTASIVNLIISARRDPDMALSRSRKNFVLAALIIAMVGIVDFLPSYGIGVYPFGALMIIICNSIIFYAIYRYSFLDVNVVITRTGVYSLSYLTVLTVPLLVATFGENALQRALGEAWWIVPSLLFVVMVSLAPYFAQSFINQIEGRLLRQERKYQRTLRQVSSSMTLIKDLDKLLKLIVYVLTRTIRLDYSAVYLLDRPNGQYVLKAKRGPKAISKIGFGIPKNSTFIRFIIKHKNPIVYEEIRRVFNPRKQNRPLRDVEFIMRTLSAAVIVPSFISNELIGFLILGNKLSGHIFTQDDLNVFSVLANQAAIAFENAQFYEDLKIANAQLFHQSKLTSLGQMASGMSHQINNRFNVLSIASSAALMNLKKLDRESPMSTEINEKVIKNVEHALVRIKENAMQGGDIVKSLLSYSRPSQEGTRYLDVRDVLDSALKLIHHQIDLDNITVKREYDAEVAPVNGDYNQLQEVFFNLIHNAYKAMKSKSEGELTVTVKGRKGDYYVSIDIKDTGRGISKDDLKYVFVPFFTSSRKSIAVNEGYGLGLFVCQKIITGHGGKIQVESELDKGTTFTVILPIAEEQK